MVKRFSNLIGVDDAPFRRDDPGEVAVVGAVYASLRLDGFLTGSVSRDGDDSTERLSNLIGHSRFFQHIQLVMLQGIAFGGFNVVDVRALSRNLSRPVLVVCRRMPDMDSIRRVLFSRIPGGRRKWALIEAMGPMEPAGGVYIQRCGLGLDEARDVVLRFSIAGLIPEPLRVAHMVAGAIVRGQSTGRP